MCTARNEMGSDIKVVHIIVKAKSHVLHTAPVIYALTSVKVDYYTSTMLFCNVTGFPLPSITWIYKNKVIQSSGNSLAVQNVTNSTVGYYTCTASNDVGTNQVRILLEASYDTPHIVTPPTTAVIVLGFSHNFTCIATGHPKPSIAWSFKSFAQESMTMPSHHIYNQGHMLNLFALKTLESGTLTCTALNEFGRDKATATVIFRNPSTTSFG
ncbi:peroxidasin homolog [Mytilus trossulus]|uniref:peroxidasin homolog n=1 Tax=Mytilus trossulus TaxID=6551 RepID=UPI003004621F